jgi:CRP/FNR family cyclic AMP-dependent transcriptional regulator
MGTPPCCHGAMTSRLHGDDMTRHASESILVTPSDTGGLPAWLQTADVGRTLVDYRPGHAIFTQGDPCAQVWYIGAGVVKVSVLSPVGKEAVVALLGPGDFLGEDGLAGRPAHRNSATTMTPTAAVAIAKQDMRRLLHAQQALSDRFIAHLLARNLRIEAELTDHLFNSSEQRLARTLVRLARHGTPSAPDRVVLRISQATLADMIGTTRSRVNFFLNKFRKLGLIEYDGRIPFKINPSLLTTMLHE